jgi:uncharacterized membrane protein
MRNLKTCSICLIVLAAAACGAPPPADNGAGNDVNAILANDTAPPAETVAANEAAPAGNESASAAEPYRASGSEPFWALTIGGGQMAYDSADGPDVTVATPPQQPTRAGYRYVTPEMTVLVNTFQRCEAANGQEYHDTVRVTIGAGTVTGCGGEVTAAAE